MPTVEIKGPHSSGEDVKTRLDAQLTTAVCHVSPRSSDRDHRQHGVGAKAKARA